MILPFIKRLCLPPALFLLNVIYLLVYMCIDFNFLHTMSPTVALHDAATRYCSVQKKIFTAQGWNRHVQACERSQVARHLDQQHTRMLRKRFKAGGQASQTPLETETGQSGVQWWNILVFRAI